jgi:formylglycine-generating enzyme required for sulfatase activity
MAGNVWEWTSTLFRDYKYKPGNGREDPNAGDVALRVLRGGSWDGNLYSARCSSRDLLSPFIRNVRYGIRVVVSPISAL